jgi:hypothetical protein
LFGFIAGFWLSHCCFRKVTSPYSIQFRVMTTMSVEQVKLGPQICDMKPTEVRRLVIYDGFHPDPMTLWSRYGWVRVVSSVGTKTIERLWIETF